MIILFSSNQTKKVTKITLSFTSVYSVTMGSMTKCGVSADPHKVSLLLLCCSKKMRQDIQSGKWMKAWKIRESKISILFTNLAYVSISTVYLAN